MDEIPLSSCFVNEEVIFAKFDVEGKEILISTNKGIRVFRLDGTKLIEINHPNFSRTGTVTAGSIYNGNNYNVIVAGNPSPKFAANCFVIMEQGEQNHFVKGVTLSRDLKIVNVLNLSRTIVAVTNFTVRVINPRIEDKPDLFMTRTSYNPNGAISGGDPFNTKCMIAFPAGAVGQVSVLDVNKLFFGISTCSEIIEAHKGAIACLAVSENSELLATASVTGTLVGVFNISTKQMVAQFRRGTTSADIHCLRFSNNNDFLGCSSSSGTIHIFAVNNQQLNRRLLEGIENWAPLNEMRSVGSFSVFRNFRYDLAFSRNGGLNVIGSDGSFRQYLFVDTKTNVTNFLKEPNSFDWILEFCKCSMFGPCYDPPKGQMHPKTLIVST